MNTNKIIPAFIVALTITLAFQFHACDKRVLDDVIVWIEIDGDPVVNQTDVTITAAIDNPGNHTITGYGFEWKKGDNIIGKHHTDAPDFNDETIQLTVDYALKANDEYTVSAYVQRPSQTIWTPPSGFMAKGSLPPLADSYFPTQGSEGDTLVITGSRFPSVNYSGPAINFQNFKVTFANIWAPISHISYDRIEAIVPVISGINPPFEIKLEIPGHTLVIGEFSYID